MTKGQHHILLLEGQTPQGLACIHSLKKADFKISIFCHEKSYGYYSRWVHRKIHSPSPKSDDYPSFLLNYLSENPVDVVIPMNDDVSPWASQFKDQINKLSRVLIPDFEIFSRGYNKNELMKVCREIDVPHPRTADLSECRLEEAADYVSFPAILKPNLTSGGRGMSLINSLEELLGKFPATQDKFGPCHLQKFIKPGGAQHKVQVLMDRGKVLIATVLEKKRYYPVKGGSSCCCTSIEHEDLIEESLKVLEHIDWNGFADFDFIQDPDSREFLLMEINPRVPACLKACIVSGADFPVAIANQTLGLGQKQATIKTGRVLRYLGFDILWFLKSKDRFKSTPPWFSFIDDSTYYQDGYWNDPVPFFMGSLLAFRKIFSTSSREKGMGS